MSHLIQLKNLPLFHIFEDSLSVLRESTSFFHPRADTSRPAATVSRTLTTTTMRLQFGDHYVSVDIYADNAKLTAYSTTIEGNVMEGWIGLEPGQKIHLNYNILSEHDIYKLEFIVDGIVRNNVDHWRNRNKKDRKTYSAIRSIIESACVSIDGKQSQREMVVGTLDLGWSSINF